MRRLLSGSPVESVSCTKFGAPTVNEYAPRLTHSA
jgi:hypothetical protein